MKLIETILRQMTPPAKAKSHSDNLTSDFYLKPAASGRMTW